MLPKNSSTTTGKNSSNDATKLARLNALAARKAKFAARLKEAKAARAARTPTADDEDEDEDEANDEDGDENDEEEDGEGESEEGSSHTSGKATSTTTRNSTDSSKSVQQRSSKLQKRTRDQDTSTGAEVGISDEAPAGQSATKPAVKLVLHHYFLPSESESNGWKLSSTEFERFGLKGMLDQSHELMFPSLPPVWKRDQLYLPESFKNQQSTTPIEERTNKILYDLDQPSRPHRRMALPQIYPNAVQTEQLNLFANQHLIIDEIKTVAPLTVGRDDPSIRSLFSDSAILNSLASATQMNATADDIEMKDASQSSSSSSLLPASAVSVQAENDAAASSPASSSTNTQAEIDAAAAKCYSFDYTFATEDNEFVPWKYHFHAQPLVCERERKKSDEYFFNDLLLAKQAQEKVNGLMESIQKQESKMNINDQPGEGAVTNRLCEYSKIYRALQASSKPNWSAVMSSIPICDFAVFLAWFVSCSKHDLTSRQFTCELLVRLLLSPMVGEKLMGDEHEKEVEKEDAAEVKSDSGAVDEQAIRDVHRPQVMVVAAASAVAVDSNQQKASSVVVTQLNLDSSKVCATRLEFFRSCSHYSKRSEMAQQLQIKKQWTQHLQYSHLVAHEIAAIKGLLFQFALKKTDEILLASIIKVLGLISAIEDFSFSWLTYIQVLAFSAGTYDLPIRTGVTPPPPRESGQIGFSILGRTALSYSTTYPLPQHYLCFSILYDLCAHHYMFGRNHFAMTNGVFDLIQSIVGTTLIQRLWQPNEEPQILNAILECIPHSQQPPAINLDGYMTYALMDLFHRSYQSGDYSPLMQGGLPELIAVRLHDWSSIVLHAGQDLALEDARPDVFTSESALLWIAPFIRLIFQLSNDIETGYDRMSAWNRTLWRSLPLGTSDGEGVYVKAWTLWAKVIYAGCLFNPIKMRTFDLEANLLDLASLVLPLLESTWTSEWDIAHGANQMRWIDFDLRHRAKAGLTDRYPSQAKLFMSDWSNGVDRVVNMNGDEVTSSRHRHRPILKRIIVCLRRYGRRLKLESEGEVWEVRENTGVPSCLKGALKDPDVIPTPAACAELGQHSQQLPKIDQVTWSYLAGVAVRIGLIKVDRTAPLGYSYVDPDLEYDPQQHRDLPEKTNLLLESLAFFGAKPGAPLEPYIKFLRLVVMKRMAESIHLSLRSQALYQFSNYWNQLFPLVGQDSDYTTKIALVKSFGMDELRIPTVLLDIITEYAFPRRSLHYSYMNLLREGVHSSFPFLRRSSFTVLTRMHESYVTGTRPHEPDTFREYYFTILFEGFELEAHRMMALGKVDESLSPSTNTNEADIKEVNQFVLQLRSLLRNSSSAPSAIFSPTFMTPFYERFQLIQLNHVESLVEELQKLNRTMKQIVEPEEESEEREAKVSAPAFNFDMSSLTGQAASGATKPLVFMLGSTTTAGTNSSVSPTTTGSSVMNSFPLSASAGDGQPLQCFDRPSITTVTTRSDPTRTIEVSNRVFNYLVAHSIDYATVHQYHRTDFNQVKMKYDPQIWFRTLQPLLKLLDNGNDISQLITILVQLLERPNLASKDIVIILHSLSPFIALVSERISIPSTASSTSFMFHFTLPTTATAVAINPTTTATPLNFNFGTNQPSTSAPPTTNSVTGSGDQGIDRISIDPNPPEQQLPAIIRSLVDSLFRVLQSTELVDVVIGNLISTHINQLLLAPSLSISDIQAWIKQWVATCPHSFEIQSDDYLRSPPWSHLAQPVNDLPVNDLCHDLGVWLLPSIHARFRFLVHLRLACENRLISEPRAMMNDYFTRFFTKPTASDSTSTIHLQSSQTYRFILSLLNQRQLFIPTRPSTCLKDLNHQLIRPLTLIPTDEWKSEDDSFSDQLIRWIHRDVQLDDPPYQRHQRSDMLLMGRFLLRYLERLGYRARVAMENRSRTLENEYQEAVKKSAGAFPGADNLAIHTQSEFECWLASCNFSADFGGNEGSGVSIIHPFMQYDPDRETLTDKLLSSPIVPSLNTAVRGLASHPDRTLFYHAPRKVVRYTCLTCTKSYAETSSYYDPCDDSHWCFNCIEWTNELTTTVRSREEFDRIYKLQLKEFHDQQLLTQRPPPSNRVTRVTDEQIDHAGRLSGKPNRMESQVFPNIVRAINHMFSIEENSNEYHGLLADLSLTPHEFNELKAAHINDLKSCLERELSSTPSNRLPTLEFQWHRTYRAVHFISLFPYKWWYEYPQLLPLVTETLTLALECEVVIVRLCALALLNCERGQATHPKMIFRHYLATCNQPPLPSHQSQSDTTQMMTLGERFEYAVLQTMGCSIPFLRSLARNIFVVRGETTSSLLLMEYINNKLDAHDASVLQPVTLAPLTFALQTIPFVYAFIRDNLDSKVITGPAMYSISHALHSPVIEPQLREARAGLGGLIQEKFLSSLTFVEKVTGHKAICAYAKLVQDGINSNSPRTPPIPKAVIQLLTKLILNFGLEKEMTALYWWFRSLTERCTAEAVLFSQLDSEDVNIAIHDTPQLRATLDAMVTLHTILPFLPSHVETLHQSVLSLVPAAAKSQFRATLITLSRAFEGLLRRCIKLPILRRLVIHPYYNLWIACSMLGSFYLIPLLEMATHVPESPHFDEFLNGLKYPEEEHFIAEPSMSSGSPGCVVLLTELLMNPPTITSDSATISRGTITTGLCAALPCLFNGIYEYVIQLVKIDPVDDGRIVLPNLNELFTRIRGWMLHRLPETKDGLVSPQPPQVGDTTIPCVFIDVLALMIQTALQLPQLTPQAHSQQSTLSESDPHTLELLGYRLVELLPVVLATFHLYATTSLADLDGQCQPVLVSMRQYIRVIHQQLKKEKQLSSHTSTRALAHADGSSSANRLSLIVQLYLPVFLHLYRATYVEVINRNKWDDLVDGLNCNRTKKSWSWTNDVPEAQLLNEVSHLPR